MGWKIMVFVQFVGNIEKMTALSKNGRNEKG